MQMNDSSGPQVYRDHLDALVASAWQSVLGHDDFGPTDSFFDVGGDSLRLALVVQRLKEETGRSDVSLLGVFQNPTPSGLRDLFVGSTP